MIRNAGITHMLIVAAEQMAKCSIPACSPVLAVVVELAKLGARVGADGVGFQDAFRLHRAGAQADSLAGAPLTQAPCRIGCIMTNVNVTSLCFNSLDELDKNHSCKKQKI